MNQELKADKGKYRPSLVPMGIVKAVAEVREFGIKKYKDTESWRKVEVERYRDSMMRHAISYIQDPHGVDAESGLSHLSHLACNVAFLVELEQIKKAEPPMPPIRDISGNFNCPHCNGKLNRTWFISGGIKYCDRCGNPIDYGSEDDY